MDSNGPWLLHLFKYFHDKELEVTKKTRKKNQIVDIPFHKPIVEGAQYYLCWGDEAVANIDKVRFDHTVTTQTAGNLTKPRPYAQAPAKYGRNYQRIQGYMMSNNMFAHFNNAREHLNEYLELAKTQKYEPFTAVSHNSFLRFTVLLSDDVSYLVCRNLNISTLTNHLCYCSTKDIFMECSFIAAEDKYHITGTFVLRCNTADVKTIIEDMAVKHNKAVYEIHVVACAGLVNQWASVNAIKGTIRHKKQTLGVEAASVNQLNRLLDAMFPAKGNQAKFKERDLIIGCGCMTVPSQDDINTLTTKLLNVLFSYVPRSIRIDNFTYEKESTDVLDRLYMNVNNSKLDTIEWINGAYSDALKKLVSHVKLTNINIKLDERISPEITEDLFNTIMTERTNIESLKYFMADEGFVMPGNQKMYPSNVFIKDTQIVNFSRFLNNNVATLKEVWLHRFNLMYLVAISSFVIRNNSLLKVNFSDNLRKMFFLKFMQRAPDEFIEFDTDTLSVIMDNVAMYTTSTLNRFIEFSNRVCMPMDPAVITGTDTASIEAQMMENNKNKMKEVTTVWKKMYQSNILASVLDKSDIGNNILTFSERLRDDGDNIDFQQITRDPEDALNTSNDAMSQEYILQFLNVLNYTLPTDLSY